jgi:curved DNA-binding protein CbpA
MDRDFYDILNIPRDASRDEIREAYLRLARQYHPDLSKKSDSREKFEEINQAYTILSDDESRTVYNHLFKEFEEREQREERDYEYNYEYGEVADESQPWWQRTAAVGAGLAVCAVLAGYSLVQYTPTLEQGLDSLAITIQSQKTNFDTLQKEKQLELTQALSTLKPAPEASPTIASADDSKINEEKLSSQNTPVTAVAQPSKGLEPAPAPSAIETAPPMATADSKVNGEKLSSQNAPVTATAQPPTAVEPALNLSEQGGEAPSIKPSARNYELLAFYSLIIGDLTQFRNAIKLAYQEDPSFDKLNSLSLSLRQLEAEKLSPEIMLKALRSLVLQEYTERLLPSQLRALQANVQNAQNIQNVQNN